jgi:CRP/FNR family cyclic AMP-dependent transcriptional regulator
MQVSSSILQAQPFLKGMTAKQIELLAKDSMLAEFNAGRRVLKEGGRADRLYLILEGRVELELPVPGGEAVPIESLGPDDVFGWSWLFAPYHCHFTARAVAPTKAIIFYGTHLHLRDLCEGNHSLGYELMKRVSEIVVKRLQATRRELMELKKPGSARSKAKK